MNAPITTPIVDNTGLPSRAFANFMNYLQSYILPKGAIVLFQGSVPKGFTEVTALTPPLGYKYGSKD